MKKKYLILIIPIIIISIIGVVVFHNHQKNSKTKELTIEAKVLAVGFNYLLITTEDELDYIVNCNSANYDIGDEIRLELKEIDKSKTPIEATTKKITIINKNTTIEENIQKNEEEINHDNQEITNKENPNEENVIAYFETLNEELTNYNNDETLAKKIKSKFVTCIDFIFYDKEISGLTFNELTDTTKLKILEILLSIDSKIDSKFPNYKESISETYKDIKNKIVEKYLDITTNICNEDKKLCTTAKENFQKLKDTFGITWNTIKDLVKKGTTKLKDWYEIWRYN